MKSTLSLLTAVLLMSLSIFIFDGCAKKAEQVDVTELFSNAQQMQMENKFHDAIGIYRKIVREHSQSREAANSQFMIGYIYANHLNDQNTARTELTNFLDKFDKIADEGLVTGAKFELEHLGKDLEDIHIPLELDSLEADTLQSIGNVKG